MKIKKVKYCPYCGSKDLTFAYFLLNLSYVKCRNCKEPFCVVKTNMKEIYYISEESEL